MHRVLKFVHFPGSLNLFASIQFIPPRRRWTYLESIPAPVKENRITIVTNHRKSQRRFSLLGLSGIKKHISHFRYLVTLDKMSGETKKKWESTMIKVISQKLFNSSDWLQSCHAVSAAHRKIFKWYHVNRKRKRGCAPVNVIFKVYFWLLIKNQGGQEK